MPCQVHEASSRVDVQSVSRKSAAHSHKSFLQQVKVHCTVGGLAASRRFLFINYKVK